MMFCLEAILMYRNPQNLEDNKCSINKGVNNLYVILMVPLSTLNVYRKLNIVAISLLIKCILHFSMLKDEEEQQKREKKSGKIR